MTRHSSLLSLVLGICLFAVTAGSTRADYILETGSSASAPLTVTAGGTSGSLALFTYSTNPTVDIMAAWNVQLEIVPDMGTSGTVSFHTPATGTVANPPNYIFGTNGLGITATNMGTTLSANDFFDPGAGSGATGPGLPGANFLLMTFSASSNASGLFGIYAEEGPANTEWTDPSFSTQYFQNVPNGTGLVRIGDVLVPAVVPEPSGLSLFCQGSGFFLLMSGLVTSKKVLSHSHKIADLS